MDLSETDLKTRLIADLAEIKQILKSRQVTLPVSEKWIPRSDLMKFLHYGATQMSSLERSGELVITKVGKRIFIHRDSLAKLLDKNIISKL